jgi:futalosine hydrolase
VRILIVAATAAEVDPCVSRWKATSGVDWLVTGVGMVATAVRCAHALAVQKYDLALNLGVCGSFDSSLRPPTVVHVVSDCIAELGAEDGDRFLTLQELQLLGDDDFPFRGGRLVNAAPPSNAAVRRLPAVHGITVNMVHGSERSIDAVVRRFQPQVESMEGAAFMYACLAQGVPFAQVRAVSNVVERRNRGAWRLKDAIDNLNATAIEIVGHL